MNIKKFRSRKDLTKFLKNENIDTTNWSELDWLQINKGQAEIHMMALAEAMWNAYNESTPKELKAGEWHIPFGDKIEEAEIFSMFETDGGKLDTIGLPRYKNPIDVMNEYSIKIATARCARVSYTVVGEEGKFDNYENDIKLHDRLAASGHWSPFEHCARTMTETETQITAKSAGVRDGIQFWKNEEGVCGNFRGFIQYRKTFNNENIQ